MTLNTITIQALREHYASMADGLTSWSYDDCVAGVLKATGITQSVGEWAVADALGITMGQAEDIVAGPRTITWSHLNDVEKRDTAVRMLDNLLATGDVSWGPQI